MGFFSWLKKAAVQDPIYSVMNDDHIQLYRILGELRQGGQRNDDGASRPKQIEIVQRLINETRNHFVREEMLMAQHNYPDLALHKSEHLMLMRSIEMFYSKLTNGATSNTEDPSQYLKAWLTNHIRTADRKLERFLFCAHKARDLRGRLSGAIPEASKLVPLTTGKRLRASVRS